MPSAAAVNWLKPAGEYPGELERAKLATLDDLLAGNWSGQCDERGGGENLQQGEAAVPGSGTKTW